jgi:hypothetical protein
MSAGFRDTGRAARRWGLGGALSAGTGVLIWSQGLVEDYAAAFVLDTAERWRGQVSDRRSAQTEPGSDPSAAAARHDAAFAQPEYEARFSREYFEPGYYSARTHGHVSAPADSFAVPWLGDLRELNGSVLSVTPMPAIDFWRAEMAAVSTAAPFARPPAPAWRFAHTGPFHVFLTSEPVSPFSSAASAAPTQALSVAPSGGIPTISSVTETAGSLLRKR